MHTADTVDYQMLIGGSWSAGEAMSDVFSPADERLVATVPIANADDVCRALAAAAGAQRRWARTSALERGRFLRRWADLIERDREHLAQVVTSEQGKPLREARGEIDMGAGWMRYFAEFDRRIEGEMLPAERRGEQVWILPQPVGVVAAIIPWNYPFAVACRKIAPALIAGNTVVLKPHESTPLSSLELAKLGLEAGVPDGVINIVTGPGKSVGEALVTDTRTRLITFTGSVPTGKRILALAAERVALVSLELGGKAPFIVMDDCDLDAAVAAAVSTRFMNCGQVCICNERTYVQRGIASAFMARFLAAVAALRVGDPLDPATVIGPKFSRSELEKVERKVADAVTHGASIAVGGRRLSSGPFAKGHWYAPTVLSNVRQDSPIMQDEIFGPVVPVMEFNDFDQALSFANDSRYGLSAYLFTKDLDRAMRAVRELEVGELYINRGAGESIHGFHSGWKESGIGGDDGRRGLDGFLRRKTVYLAAADVAES